MIHQERGWIRALFHSAGHLVPAQKPVAVRVFVETLLLPVMPTLIVRCPPKVWTFFHEFILGNNKTGLVTNANTPAMGGEDPRYETNTRGRTEAVPRVIYHDLDVLFPHGDDRELGPIHSDGFELEQPQDSYVDRRSVWKTHRRCHTEHLDFCSRFIFCPFRVVISIPIGRSRSWKDCNTAHYNSLMMWDGDIINYSTFHSLLMVSTVDVVVGVLYFVRLPSFARRKRVCWRLECSTFTTKHVYQNQRKNQRPRNSLSMFNHPWELL